MQNEYSKNLCMKQLIVRKNSVKEKKFAEDVFASSICFIKKGNAHIRFLGNYTDISENSLFYIPDKGKCRILWLDNGEGIEYIMLQAINNYPETTDKGFGLQRIESMSDEKTYARVERIYNLLSTKNRVDSVCAIAEYYGLYSEILPLLKRVEQKVLNPVLKSAVEYIEEHFCEKFNLEDLALVCNISKSRLSHLFADELGTTPIKLRSNLRIEKAAVLLTTTDDSIAKIASDCGFETQAYFTQCFIGAVGISPTSYRAGMGQAEPPHGAEPARA